jgi:hypothetical protein
MGPSQCALHCRQAQLRTKRGRWGRGGGGGGNCAHLPGPLENTRVAFRDMGLYSGTGARQQQRQQVRASWGGHQGSINKGPSTGKKHCVCGHGGLRPEARCRCCATSGGARCRCLCNKRWRTLQVLCNKRWRTLQVLVQQAASHAAGACATSGGRQSAWVRVCRHINENSERVPYLRRSPPPRTERSQCRRCCTGQRPASGWR